MERFWEVRNTAGEVIAGDKIEVRPEAQALIIRWPYGGMVWNGPIGVRVFAPTGQATGYMPIRDITRLVQVTCYALAAGFMLLGWLGGRRRSR